MRLQRELREAIRASIDPDDRWATQRHALLDDLEDVHSHLAKVLEENNGLRARLHLAETGLAALGLRVEDIPDLMVKKGRR